MNELEDYLIEKFLNGSCTETEMEFISEWFNESDNNRKDWLKIRLISAKISFDQFSYSNLINQAYQEICYKHAIQKQKKNQFLSKFGSKFFRYAAILIFTLGISFGGYRFYLYSHSKTIVWKVEENNPMQQRTLDDGTRVWLFSNSRIEYPEKFSKEKRILSVYGKAYFEVSKDTDRPFFVNTGIYRVKVLGTSFEVTSFDDSPVSDLILVEGSVEILSNQEASLSIISPGQQFEINKKSMQFKVTPIDAIAFTSWKTGILEFDGIEFSEVSKILERCYNVRVILCDDKIRHQQIMGSLSLGENIHEMMKTIELIVPINYTIHLDNSVQIKSKGNY